MLLAIVASLSLADAMEPAIQAALQRAGFQEIERPQLHASTQPVFAYDVLPLRNPGKPLYAFEEQADQLFIRETPCPHERSDVLIERPRVSYRGTDHGEFGGEFTARFVDGTTQVLVSDNVVDAIVTEQRMFVFTGNPDRVWSEGAVNVVEHYDSAPVVRLITLLPDAPVGVIRGRDFVGMETFYIAGYQSLMVLYGAQRLWVPVIDAWRHVFEANLFLKDKDLLIGFCGFLVHVRLDDLTGREILPTVRAFTRPDNSPEK